MDGRDLVGPGRSAGVPLPGPVPHRRGAVPGDGTAEADGGASRSGAWGTLRRAARRRGPERARVPGAWAGVTQLPGGGVVRFARASVAVRVARGGGVLCGWDGAEAQPSRQLDAPMPEADPRAVLEPDTQGGWRVVSERVTVGVSPRGAVEIRTPGGALLRRDEPPRWWEAPAAGHGSGRWVLRGQVAADARFLRAAGPVGEPALPDGAYRVGEPRRGGGRSPALAHPALVVTASAGTHLVWYDLAGEGVLTVRRGREGGGSGHDVPGGAHLRVSGPLRYWVLVGAPERVLPGWAALVGPRVAQAGDGGAGTLFRAGAGRL